MDHEIPLRKVLFLSIGYLNFIFCDILSTNIIVTLTAVIQQIFVRGPLCSRWAPCLGQDDAPTCLDLALSWRSQEQTTWYQIAIVSLQEIAKSSRQDSVGRRVLLACALNGMPKVITFALRPGCWTNNNKELISLLLYVMLYVNTIPWYHLWTTEATYILQLQFLIQAYTQQICAQGMLPLFMH